MKEKISLRAKEGTTERVRALAQRLNKKPWSLAGELLALALDLVEMRAVPESQPEEPTA